MVGKVGARGYLGGKRCWLYGVDAFGILASVGSGGRGDSAMTS